jgi:hypothetical protein
MAATPILAIPQVSPNQNQKEVTINNAILALEAAGNAPMAVSLAGGSATLTPTQFGAHAVFVCSGQAGVAILTVPLVTRVFFVFNADPSHSVTVGGATGTAVTVAAATFLLLWCDGTNCYASGGISGSGNVSSVVHDKFVLSIPGVPVSGRKYWYVPISDAVQIPVGMSGSAAVCGTHPATTGTVLTISYLRGGTTSTIGTVTFTSGGTAGTLSGPASAVNLMAGDILLAEFGTVDAALADVGVTLVGVRQ